MGEKRNWREGINVVDSPLLKPEADQPQLFTEEVYSDAGYVDMCTELIEDGDPDMANMLVGLISQAITDGVNVQEAVLMEAKELYADMRDEEETIITRSNPAAFNRSVRMLFKAYVEEYFSN